ncbi:MAG: formate dehydrogenase accessory sulfurtransferase FdhD [Longimicrobiales bacterium]|jgi:FdhD protein
MIAPKGGARTTRVTRYRGTESKRERDALAVEEPLEIRVSWLEGGKKRIEPLAVTMRTPGNDFELVAGFLHGEGLITTTDQLHELSYCTGPDEQEYNVVEAKLAAGVAFDPESVKRNFYATSSCGVCGKASLDAVQARGCTLLAPGLTVDAALVPQLPDRLLEAQGVFERTGGIHAAGIFTRTGERLVVMEDVGRHNAVDKVIGHQLMQRALPASDDVLVVSGRASFEVVQKAVAAGLPILVAVGAPSSLAVDLARQFGQTLIGFARNGGFNVYTRPERVA